MVGMKSIRTESEYEAALARIEQIWEAADDSPESDELESLVYIVERYEDQHETMGYPTPIGAIEFLIDQEGRPPGYLGTASEVTEVLAGARPLTPRMVHALHQCFGIPYSSMLARGFSDAGVPASRSERTP